MKHFSRFSAIALCVLYTATFNAQNPLNQPCGTPVPDQQWEDQMQRLLAQRNTQARQTTQVFTIPVIIHVIHGGQSIGSYPNLAAGQLASQIQVLNDDYGGIGYNRNNYPAGAFSNYAANNALSNSNIDGLGRVKIANCGIEFCLATMDTLGNPLAEPGIDRVNYVTKGWANPAAQTTYNNFKNLVDNVIKPGTIWNVSKYLNIWITDENLNAVGLLGYATFPPFSGLSGIPGFTGSSTTDGFWCYAKAFGSVATYPTGYYTSANTRGRTSSHEIGHWLGLRHIWGDGNCLTDYCNDTPTASSSNFGAPSYPLKTTNCSGNLQDGEMFMNFMDYVDDGIKYMFTSDQADRMQVAMTNSPYRKFMGTHNLCTVATKPATSQFLLSLNSCGVSSPVPLINNASGTPVPNFTWSASGAASFSPDPYSPAVAVSFPNGGTYTITLTADNGTVSTTSKVITVKSPELYVTGTKTACANELVTLTATGADTIQWLPGGETSFELGYIAQSEQTFTCIATGTNNCTTSTVVTVYFSQCVGVDGIGQAKLVSVYPQPVKDKLILNPAAGVTHADIDVCAITGAVLMKATYNKNEGEQAAIDCSELAKGIYFLKVSVTGGGYQAFKFIKE